MEGSVWLYFRCKGCKYFCSVSYRAWKREDGSYSSDWVRDGNRNLCFFPRLGRQPKWQYAGQKPIILHNSEGMRKHTEGKHTGGDNMVGGGGGE